MTSSTKLSNELARLVPLIMRSDLLFAAQRVRGRKYWCVKDPISLEYFHLKDEEFRILEMLNGHISVGAILKKFHEMFAPLRLTAVQLAGFLDTLLRQGLVLSNLPDSDEDLLKRQTKRKQGARVQSFMNILAIRMSGIDPDAFLTKLHANFGWLLRPWSVVAGFVLIFFASAIAILRIEQLQQSIPTLQDFLTLQNMVILALALAFVKILHEIGHGLTCKHFGGECHELGILFLVFTPCLYCDVSDIWMLPNKWRRIAVSIAGIYTELVLAALCTIVWAYSQPGFLHTACLNVMLVCSVNAIFFNGNILLRYDGYYMFSDLIEIPNLAQRSKAALSRFLSRHLLGIGADEKTNSNPEEPTSILIIYAVASTLYRLFVIAAILFFCHQLLKPLGLRPLADMITFSTLLTLSIPMFVGGVSLIRDPVKRRQIRKGRTFSTGLLCAILIGLIAILPVPFNVDAVASLQLSNAKRVFVSTEGILTESLAIGSIVEQDQVIAVLKNPEIERDVQRLRDEIRELEQRLRGLESRRLDDPTATKHLGATREMLKDIAQQLVQRERDMQKLTLRAPIAGTILPPPYVVRNMSNSIELGAWAGHPMDARNMGCFLNPGTLFCLVGSPKELEALLLVDESQIPFVEVGQEVKIQFDQRTGDVYHATVTEISEDNLTIAPKELAASQKVAIRRDGNGQTRLLESSYQVRVDLQDVNLEMIRLRATGRAKILASRQTLAARLYRYLRRTFQFQF